MRVSERPIPENTIRDDQLVLDTIHGTSGNDHLIHHRDPDAGSGVDNTSFYGGSGDDILEGSVPSHGQLHMYGGRGDDWFILDVTKNEGANIQGHHAIGGPGSNTYQFANIAEADSMIVGRLENFAYGNDQIMIEDTPIDLKALPQQVTLANGDEVHVRVVELEQTSIIGEDLGPQQFLAIGDNVFYALEGARDLGNGELGNTGDEAHFVYHAGNRELLREAEPVDYVDPQNYVPTDLYEHRADEMDFVWRVEGEEVTLPETAGGVNFHASLENSTVHGSSGDDVINGESLNMTILGGEGDDLIAGGLDFDVLHGNEGDDMLWGGDGNDTLFGDEGDDFLDGGRGDDILNGGEGSDTLVGGRGDDTLTGGRSETQDGGGEHTHGGGHPYPGDDGDDSGEGEHTHGGAHPYPGDAAGGAGEGEAAAAGGEEPEESGEGGEVEANTFHFADGDGNDVITDFNLDADLVTFQDDVDPDSIRMWEDEGGNTVIGYGDESSVQLEGISLEDFQEAAAARAEDGNDIVTITPDPEAMRLEELRVETGYYGDQDPPDLHQPGVQYGAEAFTSDAPGGYRYSTAEDEGGSGDDDDDEDDDGSDGGDDGGIGVPVVPPVPGDDEEESNGGDDDQQATDSTCFVATAAYADPRHPDVVFLRAFRDKWLVNRAWGRAFVGFYWRVGPVLARLVRHRPALAGGSRLILSGVVRMLQKSGVVR